MKKYLFFLLTGFIFILSCADSDPSPAPPPDVKLHVRTAAVTRGDISDTLHVFGRVALRQEAFLASQFDGRLTDFSLLLGDRVKKAQQVGILIPARREALLQIADQVPAQLRPLLSDQIKPIPLYSPLDGIVLAVFHHSGDVVQKGEHIAQIGDLSRLDIRGDLPLRYLPAVQKAGIIRVDFLDYPHAPLRLPIAAISGNIQPDNQTVMLRLGLKNDKGEFRPGMMVKLSFPSLLHRGALLVPRQALLEDEGVFSLFVLKGNRVEQRQVKVGILRDGIAEILSGIHEGEQVVTRKAYSLEDGMEVVVE